MAQQSAGIADQCPAGWHACQDAHQAGGARYGQELTEWATITRRALFAPSAASWGREFAQRAALYRQWDRALSESTRFYAAAALINAAFAESLASPLGLLLSSCTVEFFGSMGRALLAFNADLAGTLLRSREQGRQLDASIVRGEQSIVEHHLAELHGRERRAHRRLVREANGLLSLVPSLTRMSSAFPHVTVLGMVLRQLHSARGRVVNFADRDDREAVGNALIESARRASPTNAQ